MHIHKLLTDNQDIADICARFATADFITVDTEFMRENTYWPILCLIQISDGKEAAAIDPLAKGVDLGPLLELMVNNEDVLKIFHAGGQDVEIIHNLTGKTPHPIFDTQIAAMAIGQSEQIGYANLVDSWLGITLDKGARFTDWSRRPLNARQLEYAIADVTHLATIFPMMLEKLKETGRGRWINAEMEKLADPENYVNDPEKAWLRIKSQGRNLDMLGRLKALAAWREREAQSKDLPRGRIMRDETLADIAAHPPKDQTKLGQVRGLSAGWKNNDIGARLMDIIDQAEPLSRDDLPLKIGRRPKNGKSNALVTDLLKLLLKIRSAEMNVASRLLARADDLERIVAGEREDVPLLEGWRYEEFGRDALDLVEGRVSFTVKDGKLKMTHQQEGDTAEAE
ncbi:MAG: ribonuclease D [Sphingomonadales bacterium]|nr:ribonuclease D [Sphingomonadales bacterium]PIX67542.1 MAG: ribonuclease D [Sphingomonadales bacterium CG_4_10_14_3_um_filter_58_15]NCO49365.1 ribonuclease D [Sphingomonadales bacterium]NCP00086.1 ribonuclease D [Sphingomonadales bacterium]NCP27231.1 ribonuclease D [Sphingomonadales bacterium]